MPFVGFEPTIPASEQLQTHALERVATRIRPSINICFLKKVKNKISWVHTVMKWAAHIYDLFEILINFYFIYQVTLRMRMKSWNG